MGDYKEKFRGLIPKIPGFKKCKLKGIVVIIDGLGDLPCALLNEKTPLESANTSNLDFLATRGELGYMYPVKPTFIPESDEALVSIFGNKFMNNSRGQLEARGIGINLTRGDLALRVNFATIDSKTHDILDRRAGRTLTTAEAEVLAESLQDMDFPIKFEFKPTMQHRGVLVFKGGFSEDVTGNDITYAQGKAGASDKLRYPEPTDDTEIAHYTANVLKEFLEKAHIILEKHPINIERKKKGLLPANYLLVRGAGVDMPRLKPYKRWFSTAYTPLETGFSKVSGMKIFPFSYPRLTDFDSYGNAYEAIRKACKFATKTIKSNSNKFNYAYVHIKETDLPGHDNKPVEKKIMLEYLDSTLFHFLRKFAPPNKIQVVVTGDHSTPCKLKSHSADPVPLLFYNDSNLKEKKFSEKDCRIGTFGRVLGNDLLKKVGFVR